MLKITGPLKLRSEMSIIANAADRRIVCASAYGAPVIADFGEDTPEARTLASLFAAAPDMLEALKNAIPFLVQLGDFIGNGAASESGLGARCDALLAARNALVKSRCG